ncbi:hypothetical protein [Paraflavitalea sp. CAU 1676]|uniref:hypothetical protein n=1 Tax=Paraflavitalea sp. CAU 1676 TaxID=3032598 RepID=UPI0023DA04A0|nr:hypothetical protein [Paraflavitalea sp. CAU 1676]MDF2186813.1 hypothetical protein [Paraflavitalea sp. CAU 1676]
MKPETLEIPNQLRRLSHEEQSDPKSVLAEFFTNYHLHDLRDVLWEWLCAGLCHDGSWFQEGLDRSNLLFLYENLEKLAEAAYLLHRKAEQKGQTKRKSKTTKKNSHASKREKSTQ